MANSDADKNIEGKIKELPPEKRVKRKKLILIGGILIILLFGFTGAIFFIPDAISLKLLNKKDKRVSGVEKEESKKIGYLYGFDPIIVNLADTEIPRYLKIRIELEGYSPKPEEEIDKRIPQIKDAIITVLSSKTFKEIYDREGKKRLKEELLQRVEQLLGEHRIKKIYFTEFVIQ